MPGPTLDQKRAVLEGVTRKLLSRLHEDLDFLKSHGFGVTIFAFDFGDAGAIAYISTSERAAMIEAVKVWLAQQEAGLETDPRGERPRSSDVFVGPADLMSDEKIAEWRAELDALLEQCVIAGVTTTQLGAALFEQMERVIRGVRDNVLSSSAEMTAVLAKLDLELERLRAVVGAAIAWRETWRRRAPFGEEAKAVALVDAVDRYEGRCS